MPAKVRVRLKSLAEKDSPSYPMTEKAKPVVRYPQVTFSADQLQGAKDLKVGKKCRLVVEAEVVEISQPSEYEIANGKSKDDLSVRLKLTKGALDKMEGEGGYS